MKSVLIVGENSYIGCSIEKWFGDRYSDYRFDTITVRELFS